MAKEILWQKVKAGKIYKYVEEDEPVITVKVEQVSKEKMGKDMGTLVRCHLIVLRGTRDGYAKGEQFIVAKNLSNKESQWRFYESTMKEED